MIKIKTMIIIIILITFNIPIPSMASEETDYLTEMKQDILTLMLAYPEYIVRVEKKSDNKVYCIMKSGTKILYDDKVKKNNEEKLSNPDLQDILEQKYPLNKVNGLMEKSFDPGRARSYDILNEVYGSSKKTIEKNLIALKCGYTNYQFNKNNSANTSLEAALNEVIPLSKNRSDIASILYPASGTYNYRVISGTGRLSPHSYGIAIDLKSDKRDYWKWSSEEQGNKRILEYPNELVEAFEKNNFVWGGKWGHFDILHFEYRPEIILKAKYFGNWKSDNNWYDGAPINDENTQKYINLIEEELK
ncbi:M15 family metallopeptidase [Clostridium paraputrificum]|uniref:M15 family metallopeptidase n=1 Tax=Clostridium TaxID=1485 RepID=UPI003D341E29